MSYYDFVAEHGTVAFEIFELFLSTHYNITFVSEAFEQYF